MLIQPWGNPMVQSLKELFEKKASDSSWKQVRNTHGAEQRELMLKIKGQAPFSATLHVAALHQILSLRQKQGGAEPLRIIIGEPDNQETSPTVIASAMIFAAMFHGDIKVFLAMSQEMIEKYHDEVSQKLHRNAMLRAYFFGVDPTLEIPNRWFIQRMFRTQLEELGIEIINPENLPHGDASAIGDFLAGHLTEKEPTVNEAIKMPVWVASAAAVMGHKGISYAFAGKGVPSGDVIVASIRLALKQGERLTSMALLHRRFVPEHCPHLIVLADPAVNPEPTINDRVQYARLVARTMLLERSIHRAFAHPDDAERGTQYMGVLSYSTKKSGKGGPARESEEVARRAAEAVAHMGVHCFPHPMQGDAQYNASTTKGPHNEGYGRCGGSVASGTDQGNVALKFLSLNTMQAITSGPMLAIYRPDDPFQFRPSVIGDQSRDDGTRAIVQSMVDTILFGFLCRMNGSVAAH